MRRRRHASIQEIDADAQVRVDLERGSVAVESAQPTDALKDAIDEAGYTVVSAKRRMTRGTRFRVALIGASGLLGRAVADELAARKAQLASRANRASAAATRAASRSISAMTRAVRAVRR